MLKAGVEVVLAVLIVVEVPGLEVVVLFSARFTWLPLVTEGPRFGFGVTGLLVLFCGIEVALVVVGLLLTSSVV